MPWESNKCAKELDKARFGNYSEAKLKGNAFMYKGLRLGVRAIIMHRERLLLVNAYKTGTGPELWCAPGGGVEPHQSLHDNLKREVFEETGLEIEVGEVALVNEFHDPEKPFHQVDIFFRAHVKSGRLDDTWTDPEGIVERRAFFSEDELRGLLLKPSSLPQVAFNRSAAVGYDPLELILK